jgi:hypothetical protein
MGICSRTEFVHVHKDVWETITTPDEAITPLVIEPLDVPLYSFSHRFFPPIRLCDFLLWQWDKQGRFNAKMTITCSACKFVLLHA